MDEEKKDNDIIVAEKVDDNKDENQNLGDESTIKISNDTVATYAGIAISEIPGDYGMSGTFAGITEAISGKKNYAKGIKVDIADNKTAKIDVNIIVEYGARIPEVAFEIQTKVKKSVETMTGLKVSSVNVNIQGVHAITEKDEKNSNDDED